jgi:hypothetical protein
MTNQELRKFGFIMAGMIVLLFGWSARPWPFVVSSVFALLAAFTPQALHYPHALWMKFGHYAGMLNTKIILGFIFFLLITPIGLLRRLMGTDRMGKSAQPGWTSYRITRVTFNRGKAMERPF